jgi:AcrR family transcriptional regulator
MCAAQSDVSRKLGGKNLAKAPKGKVSDRRDQIVSAATELFYEYGFQKATMRDICGKIGITQAALYYHFRNKEEILYTIIEKSSNDLYFTLKSCLSGKKDAVEELREAILQHILSIKHGRKGAKIIIEDKRFLSGELNKQVKEKEMAIFHFYKDRLEELQRMKRVKDGDLTVATFGILAMINWLYHWYRPEKKLSLKEIGERVVDLLFNGLLTNRT